MILISHRGNINGRNPKLENSHKYIIDAIKAGYDVEIDIREIDGKLFLGHNKPQYETQINYELFVTYGDKLWIHCKNIPVLHTLMGYKNFGLNLFFHDRDQCVLTSKSYIWTYPGYSLGPLGKENNSICVLPETVDYEEFNCVGICSDVIEKYK